MHGVLVFVIMMVNMAFLGEIKAKDVDFYLHQQGLDTSTPAGRAMFQMLGVFSEFERAMIQERVRAGLARARSKGTRLGRPRKVTPRLVRKIKEAPRPGQADAADRRGRGCQPRQRPRRHPRQCGGSQMTKRYHPKRPVGVW